MTNSGISRHSLRNVQRVVALMIVDGLALYFAELGAYQLRALQDKPLLPYASFREFSELSLALVPAWIIIFGLCGLYTTRQSYGRASEAGRVTVAVTIGMMLLMVIDYLSLGSPLFPGRQVPFYALGLGILAVLAGRQLLRSLRQRGFRRGHGLHRIVVFGTGPLAERIVADLRRRGHGNEVVAAVAERAAGGMFAGTLFAENVPVYASLDEVLAAHEVGQLDEIVNADPQMGRTQAVELMSFANTEGLGYRFVPDMYGVFAASSVMSTISGVPVMEVRLTSLDGWGAVTKRIIDAVGSLVGLFLLAPLFLSVAALIKITDPAGPVLYRQERLGRAGKPIGIFKFRSMLWEYSTGPDRPYKTAVEAFRAMGRADLCAEFEVAQKVADDPRVSRLGEFLRRTSLDELPQLFNSLLGHISLVGPRPITPVELERYGAHRSSFLALKPGITGLWQVSGRSDVGYDQRVKLDVFYVENWSAWLDISILARTVVTVAARRGAY